MFFIYMVFTSKSVLTIFIAAASALIDVPDLNLPPPIFFSGCDSLMESKNKVLGN